MAHHDALLVARHPTGDTALVVEFLTPDAGRLPCVARSARRSRQRFVGGLDTLCRLDVDVQPPRRGELHELTESHVTDGYDGLRTDPVRLGRAGYVLELAAALTPREHAAVEAFGLCVATLHQLSEGPCGAGLLRWAETHLLVGAGLLPPTDCCAGCHAPLGREAWCSTSSPGALVCASCREPGDAALGADAVALLVAASGWSAAQAAAADVSPPVAQQVGRWLAPVLHAAVGRKLKSAAFLAQVQRMGGGDG